MSHSNSFSFFSFDIMFIQNDQFTWHIISYHHVHVIGEQKGTQHETTTHKTYLTLVVCFIRLYVHTHQLFNSLFKFLWILKYSSLSFSPPHYDHQQHQRQTHKDKPWKIERKGVKRAMNGWYGICQRGRMA